MARIGLPDIKFGKSPGLGPIGRRPLTPTGRGSSSFSRSSSGGTFDAPLLDLDRARGIGRELGGSDVAELRSGLRDVINSPLFKNPIERERAIRGAITGFGRGLADIRGRDLRLGIDVVGREAGFEQGARRFGAETRFQEDRFGGFKSHADELRERNELSRIEARARRDDKAALAAAKEADKRARRTQMGTRLPTRHIGTAGFLGGSSGSGGRTSSSTARRTTGPTYAQSSRILGG